MWSVHSFHVNPKFGNNFGECVRYRKDVTFMETGVCTQHYSMNNSLILQLVDKLNTDESIADIQMDYEDVSWVWLLKTSQ